MPKPRTTMRAARIAEWRRRAQKGGVLKVSGREMLELLGSAEGRSQPQAEKIAGAAAEGGPIPLSRNQEWQIAQWAADAKLWGSQETARHNLTVFARVILADKHPPDVTELNIARRNA